MALLEVMHLSLSRLSLALQHVDRWREVARCIREFDNPSSLVATYIGLKRMAMPATAHHSSGLRLQINEFGDVETIWQIFVRRVYDVRPEDRVIIDAGANIGLFTCYASWRAPQSRILTIEPFPSTVERLKIHIADNDLNSRVIVLNRALSASPGEVAMAMNPLGSQQNCVLQKRPPEGQTVIRVPSMPLSEAVAALPERIDLLKMDIEGSEFEVLLNTPVDTLQRFRRINLEHHEPRSGTSFTKAALIAHIEKAGFTVRQHVADPSSLYGVLHCEQSN